MTLTEVLNTMNNRTAAVNEALPKLSDETALDAIGLFPFYRVGITYQKDTRIRYGEKLYRCEQAHTSQTGWEPPNVPALWTEVAKPGEIPVWRQPTGAQDAYNTGDKVHYPDADGPVYVSKIDGNVWSPEAYPDAWEVVT